MSRCLQLCISVLIFRYSHRFSFQHSLLALDSQLVLSIYSYFSSVTIHPFAASRFLMPFVRQLFQRCTWYFDSACFCYCRLVVCTKLISMRLCSCQPVYIALLCQCLLNANNAQRERQSVREREFSNPYERLNNWSTILLTSQNIFNNFSLLLRWLLLFSVVVCTANRLYSCCSTICSLCIFVCVYDMHTFG